MMLLLAILGVMVSIGMVSGFQQCEGWSAGVMFNTLSSPYFQIGISNELHALEDGKHVQVVSIGLFPILIEFEFFKKY